MFNALLPNSKKKQSAEVMDQSTPKGRLALALGGIIRDLVTPRAGKTDPRLALMVTGLQPLLRQTLEQLSNLQVCELVRNLRLAMDWIEYGHNATSPQVNGEDAISRGNRDGEDNPG